MRKINIDTIPHDHQRYPTCGDYWEDKDGIEQVRVSYFPDWRMGALVILHELIESILCKHREISEPAITQFDIDYDKVNKAGEPGDDPSAPYYHEHYFSTIIERMVAAELGVNWNEYGKAIDALFGKE